MSKVCQITGRRVQKGNNVSHSKRRTKRTFAPNLRMKRYYLASEDRWITLKVSTAGMRTIDKVGLEVALRKAQAKGFIEI